MFSTAFYASPWPWDASAADPVNVWKKFETTLYDVTLSIFLDYDYRLQILCTLASGTGSKISSQIRRGRFMDEESVHALFVSCFVPRRTSMWQRIVWLFFPNTLCLMWYHTLSVLTVSLSLTGVFSEVVFYVETEFCTVKAYLED